MKEKTSILLSCLAGILIASSLVWFISHPNALKMKNHLMGTPLPSTLTSAQQNQVRAYSDFVSGLLYEQKGLYREAASKFESTIKSDSTAHLARIHHGVSLSQIGEETKANLVLDEATALHENKIRIRSLAALIYVSQARFDDAIRQLKLALEEFPKDQFILNSLAEVYVVSSRLALAIDIFDQLAVLQPDNALVYFNMAIVESRLGRYESASEHLIKAVSLDPKSTKAWIALGLIYEKQDKSQQALEVYNKALLLESVDLRIYHNIARLHRLNNDNSKAMEQYEKVLTINPSDAIAALDLSAMYLDADLLERAIKVLTIPMSHGVEHYKLYFMKGYALSLLGRTEEAKELYLKSIRLNPAYARAYFFLGILYDELNEINLAKQYLLRSIELNPHDAEVYNYLGYLMIESGAQLDQAIVYIQKALSINPRSAAFLDSLGWAYYKKGLYNQAVMRLEQAAQIDKDDIVIRQHLIESYDKLNKNESGIKMITNDGGIKDQSMSPVGL